MSCRVRQSGNHCGCSGDLISKETTEKAGQFEAEGDGADAGACHGDERRK